MEPRPPASYHLQRPYDLSHPHPHHPPPGVDPMSYHPPPPPAYPYNLPYLPAPPVPYFTPEQQTICTLFLSGLPDDVKAREIHNLFRLRNGFQSCQLEYTGRGNQVVAFATFVDHRSAVAAMTELNGATFDPQTGSKLFVELARSNSRTKRPRGGGGYTIIDKRVKVANDNRETLNTYGDGGSDELLDSDNDKSSNKASLHPTKSDHASVDVDHIQASGKEMPEKLVGDTPTCSTLFIANLSPNCTEEQLKKVLSQCSGFQFLKMTGRSGKSVAFADFKDVECSTEALNSLQGKVLDKSDHAMHVEYARSKMRRD